ncbi:hypothetical protein F53441_7143 [Fusarium austroafricanum]|uniref:BTB domain-containing protein n=1 Tax=Fusarium austroafricanum TaxID=2364996 RepID=A0A8H4KGW8_9HYPO|nr:hypothetical protein F53441_7143 [Fusarium austroafricanum]
MVSIEKSPYSDEFAEVRFKGENKTRVHRGILVQSLQSSPRLIKGLKHGSPPDLTLNLEDVPPHVGHVILHYLYTGRYSCCPSIGGNPSPVNAPALSVALQVMVAAESLEWTSMQMVSMDEALRLCAHLSLPMILETFDRLDINFDKFPKLEAHLQQRLLDYKSGRTVPLEDGFTCKTRNTLSNVLFKALVAIKNQESADESKTKETQDDDELSEIVTADPEPTLEIDQTIFDMWDYLSEKYPVPQEPRPFANVFSRRVTETNGKKEESAISSDTTGSTSHQPPTDTKTTPPSNPEEDQELDSLLEKEKKESYLSPQDYDRLLLLWVKRRGSTLWDTQAISSNTPKNEEIRVLIGKLKKQGYLYSHEYYRLFALWGLRKRRQLKDKWNKSVKALDEYNSIIPRDKADLSRDSDFGYQVHRGTVVSDADLERASWAHFWWRNQNGLPSIRCRLRCMHQEPEDESDWTSVGQMTPGSTESESDYGF